MQFKVTATELRIRKTPSLKGTVLDPVLIKNEIIDSDKLSDDEKWVKVTKDGVTGWSFHQFLQLVIADAPEPVADDAVTIITDIAAASGIFKFNWANRGIAPAGYIKGMALVFARVYGKLKNGDAAAVEMAKADTGKPATDALSFYAARFDEAGMHNEASGADTLRHLFVLMMGLGMRESSGRYCEGRDVSADNTTSNSAEAGLFQTSFNAVSSSPLLPGIFTAYQGDIDGFIDVFKQGVTAKPADLKNFGSGNGKLFQQLSKEKPAFATEFAAVALRNIRTHWGPINTRKAEVRPEANIMLLQVQNAVDAGAVV